MQKEGLEDISLISLPYVERMDEETGEKIIDDPDYETPEEEYLWRVEYLNGCNICYYKPAKEDFV